MKVLVLNPANPEMNVITEALAQAGHLGVCLFPYRTAAIAARFAPRVPFLGTRLGADLDRRRILANVPDALIAQPAAGWEFARAIVSRARRSGMPLSAEVESGLIDRRNRKIGLAARAYLRTCDVVLATETMALEAFEEAGRNSVLRVLEGAIAHHRFSARRLQEEADLHPHLACTLQRHNVPERRARRWDREYELADCVLVASRFVAETYTTVGVPADRIVKANYGVDASRFEPGPFVEKPDPFRVVFVGAIGQRKGISYLFDAYRAFRKPDTELTLVGAPIGGLDALAPYRGLFRHIPFVPHWELPPIYRSSSVFVLPTIIEGFGLVVLEAMASGLPAIVTPCGPDEVVQDGVSGFVVPIRDPEAIADRLERLYRDPELRRRMGDAARRRALEFTWERYGREVVGLLQERLALWKDRPATETT